MLLMTLFFGERRCNITVKPTKYLSERKSVEPAVYFMVNIRCRHAPSICINILASYINKVNDINCFYLFAFSKIIKTTLI